jgi:hypothetical protein
MGTHIYSGSLVRFFTNEWENEIQRWARENGHGYRPSWWSGKEPKWPTREEAATRLGRMRSEVIQKFHLEPETALWRDNVAEYHTIKLHAEGREAIKIVTAHLHRPDLPFPTKMPQDPELDPAYAEAGKKGYLIGPIAAFDCSLIVPGNFGGVGFVTSPMNEQVLLCSIGFLRAALDYVATGYWKGAAKPQQWRKRGLIFSRDSGSMSKASWWKFKRDAEPKGSLKGNAEFAFGVYSEMVAFADTHGTAIAIW